MKALSIRQPWAWCIVHAGKDAEVAPVAILSRREESYEAGRKAAA